MAKKRLGDLLLELKAKTPGAMPTLGPESIEQALATQKQEGGRLGEILLKMRAITEEDLLQVLGQQLGHPLQPGSEDGRRRHRPGDVDPDRLRQAAPAAGGQAGGRLRDGGDRRSAGDRRVRRPAHAAVARGAAVPGAVAADPRGHQRRLRPQGRQGRRSRRQGRPRTTRGAARSWSTSSRSPTRRRSSAGSTRCCSTPSRSGRAIFTSSRARRRSSSATASTASCTSRGARRASSCRRSSRA